MKHILITGVSSGIGYDAVRYFLQQSYRVFGSVRTEGDAERLRRDFPRDFYPLIFDVRDGTAIHEAKIQVERTLQGAGLDVLVNNAGISINGPMALVPLKALRLQLDVNVMGLLAVTQAFLPLLGLGTGSKYEPGLIINIGSGAGRITRPYMGPYAASKHAVEALSDAMRRELADFGIKVVLVQPAAVNTPIFQKAKRSENPYKDTEYEAVYDKLGDVIDQLVSAAIPVRKVSRVLYKAAVHPNPKTRYFVASNKVKLVFWLATHVLPDKILDKIFRKQLKKSALKT
ncbi:MAG: SDR family oxidoreductase [Flavobacteriales bacterium]